MGKDTFIVYGEWEKHFALLSPPQQGELIMAIFAYRNRGELPEGDPAVQMAFSFIRLSIDENDAKWEQERAARVEAGRIGGLARASKAKQIQANQAKLSNANQTQANQAVSVPVSVPVSVSESVSVPPNGGDITRARRFTPPTVEQVAAYVAERGSPVDPQEFVDFYAAKGWMVGKTPMKDWKAACRNAEKWDRWKRTTASERPLHPQERPSFAEIAAKMEGKT